MPSSLPARPNNMMWSTTRNWQMNARREITLAQYLTYAYMLAPIKDSRNPAIPAQPIPLKDPDLGEMPQPLADDRVHNPTDNSYEAAVRGALEQFAGSPYFKHDPDKVLYDKMLQEAFQDNTTIYTPDGSVPADRSQRQDLHETQQSRQLRGMVIQDIIGDLQAYAEKTKSSTDQTLTPEGSWATKSRSRWAWSSAIGAASLSGWITSRWKARRSRASSSARLRATTMPEIRRRPKRWTRSISSVPPSTPTRRASSVCSSTPARLPSPSPGTSNGRSRRIGLLACPKGPRTSPGALRRAPPCPGRRRARCGLHR